MLFLVLSVMTFWRLSSGAHSLAVTLLKISYLNSCRIESTVVSAEGSHVRRRNESVTRICAISPTLAITTNVNDLRLKSFIYSDFLIKQRTLVKPFSGPHVHMRKKLVKRHWAKIPTSLMSQPLPPPWGEEGLAGKTKVPLCHQRTL